GRDGFAVDVAGGAVDGDIVALVVGLAAEGKVLCVIVDVDFAAAGNAAGTHATSNNRCVGGHAAADGQDALSNLHAFDVLRGGLAADQNDLLALLGPLFCVLSREDDLAASCARGSRQALANDGRLLQGVRVELRMQQSVELLRLYA